MNPNRTRRHGDAARTPRHARRGRHHSESLPADLIIREQMTGCLRVGAPR